MALIGAKKLGQLLVLTGHDRGGIGSRRVSEEWTDKVLQCLSKIDFVAEPAKGARSDAREDGLARSESR